MKRTSSFFLGILMKFSNLTGKLLSIINLKTVSHLSRYVRITLTSSKGILSWGKEGGVNFTFSDRHTLCGWIVSNNTVQCKVAIDITIVLDIRIEYT